MISSKTDNLPAAYRAAMTPAQRAKQAADRARRYAAWTPEQREKNRAYQAARRAAWTPEQREKNKAYYTAYNAAARAKLIYFQNLGASFRAMKNNLEIAHVLTYLK